MKMIKEKLAVAIKTNGKILRENKDIVRLPYGSEFSVFVKNLNSRRIKFNLHIDGTDVLGGEQIVVDANSETEIKRFIRNGNLSEGNAFKFIERTQSIEDGPRGIKVDDGIIRIEFWLEKEVPEVKTVYHVDTWWDQRWPRRYPYHELWNISDASRGIGPQYSAQNVVSNQTPRDSSPIYKGAVAGQNALSSAAGMATNSSQSAHLKSKGLNTPKHDGTATCSDVNEIGITVPGSKVQQQFNTVYGFNAEANSDVIIIRMVGMSGEVEVTQPITVKTKMKCVTCSRVNKATSAFCSQCGTALTLF